MSRGFSIYLDGLRFFAAMLVLLSHFAYPRFSDGRWLWVRELNLGSDAVVIFFVLSGLVISYATQSKSAGAGQYAFDRLTRLLSVAFPALILGYALDRLGAQLDPSVYNGWMYNPLPLWEVLVRGLSFSNEWTGLATRLGTNGPYWSLSYEAAYYALFGVAVFTTGLRRIVFLALGCWVVGLNILLLLPAWLAGVVAHRVIAHETDLPKQLAIALAVVPLMGYVIALTFDLPDVLRTPIEQFRMTLRFSDEFIWNNILAVFVALHLIGVAHLLRKSEGLPLDRTIRWLAGGSFSLYLVHYPVLQFLAALGLASRDLQGDVLLLGLSLVACYVFAEISERRLPWARKLLRNSINVASPSRQHINKTGRGVSVPRTG